MWLLKIKVALLVQRKIHSAALVHPFTFSVFLVFYVSVLMWIDIQSFKISFVLSKSSIFFLHSSSRPLRIHLVTDEASVSPWKLSPPLSPSFDTAVLCLWSCRVALLSSRLSSVLPPSHHGEKIAGTYRFMWYSSWASTSSLCSEGVVTQ